MDLIDDEHLKTQIMLGLEVMMDKIKCVAERSAQLHDDIEDLRDFLAEPRQDPMV